jgi:hypothetical protein
VRYPLLLLALLAACSDAPTEPEIASWVWVHPYLGAPCAELSPGPSLDPARRDSIPMVTGRLTSDDRTAEIARQAPGGWGGTFLEDGRMIVYLVQPESADVAIPELRRLGAGVTRWAEIRRARWDFAQLYDWYRYLAHRGLWSIDGVWMSDIDESENRIQYGVTPDGLPDLAELLTALGVPCGLVTAEVAEPDFGW